MKRFAVIGNPIQQSKSPIIHETFAKQFGIELTYDKILSTKDEFNHTVKDFFMSGLGMNVTAPFKELAFEFAHELTSRATLAGAVNTLYVNEGIVCGDTTDGAGLTNDLKYHGVELTGKSVLLLGAGGAAKGSVSALLDEKPKQFTLANRTLEKALAIQNQYEEGKVCACSFADLTDEYDVVINSTSCSLTNDILDISPRALSNAQFVYDMSYKKEQTSFNNWAAQHSDAQTIDGLGMLVEQAAVSFSIWHGLTPNTDSIREILRSL